MPALRLPESAASLADAVASAVRDGIQRQELVPDETYSVYQLAELLGVSRSPVREALLRLAEAGLVEISRNRGFRVMLPQAHDIEEIFEIRLALEPPAARRVAEHGSDDDLAVIASHMEALRCAGARRDAATFWAMDRALHEGILRAAGNARAVAIIAQLRATTALLGPPTTATGRSLVEILDEHAPIVTAVLARDGDLAETAMREHLVHTGALLADSLRVASYALLPINENDYSGSCARGAL